LHYVDIIINLKETNFLLKYLMFLFFNICTVGIISQSIVDRRSK